MKIILILNLYFLFYSSGYRIPDLILTPNVQEIKLPLNSKFVVTCGITEVTPYLVDTNIKWLDQGGKEITERMSFEKSVYVELIPGRPEKQLFFNKLSSENAGIYKCESIVEGNIKTKEIFIQLYQDVTYDNAPSPQYITEGKNGRILCLVSGNPSPTIHWSFRGENLIYDTKYVQDVYGLNIINTTRDDEGVYSCKGVVKEMGLYKSKEIEVIVETIPQIDKSVDFFQGIQSFQFTLPCKSSGKPPPRFEFHKKGMLVHSIDRRQFDPLGGQLIFRPLSGDDEGEYKCSAFNNAGVDSFIFYLDVIVPPAIISFQNKTGVENESFDLSCISEGDPPPQITIKKSSIIPFTDPTKEFSLGENEKGRIVVSRKGTKELNIHFNRLLPTDMCNYTCISINKGGKHERNATITVNFSPQFDPGNMKEIFIWPGKTRNLTCLSFAEPMPFIQWIKYPSIPRPIYSNQTYRVHIMGKNSNLQITVREEDQNWIYGDYFCVVKNQYGENKTTIKLKKAFLPGPPKEAYVVEVTSTTALLKIEPPEMEGGEMVTEYRIDFEDRVLRVNRDEKVYIEYLRPSTKFIFQIRATSEVGDGSPLRIEAKTLDVMAPEPIEITSVPEAGLSSRYTITWKKPLTGGIPIKEYEFKIRKVKPVFPYSDNLLEKISPLEKWQMRLKQDDPSRPMFFYRVEGLKSRSFYQLEIRARNDVGWSEKSKPFVFSTLTDPFEGAYKDSSVRKSSFLTIFLILFLNFLNSL